MSSRWRITIDARVLFVVLHRLDISSRTRPLKRMLHFLFGLCGRLMYTLADDSETEPHANIRSLFPPYTRAIFSSFPSFRTISSRLSFSIRVTGAGVICWFCKSKRVYFQIPICLPSLQILGYALCYGWSKILQVLHFLEGAGAGNALGCPVHALGPRWDVHA